MPEAPRYAFPACPSGRQRDYEKRRDDRVDFFRGCALLCIFIDHIPGNALARLTLHNHGFSDAAELFVLLTGCTAAYAYAKPAAAGALARRIAAIYGAQILLVLTAALILFAAVVLTGHESLARHKILLAFASEPQRTLWRTLLLDFQPEYFDILPLYILLLMWLPAVLALARTDKRLALGVSAAVWLAAMSLQINLPGQRNGGWYFDPFSWQLVFTAGVLLGLRGIRKPGTREPHSRALLAVALAFLAFSFLYAAPWSHLPLGEWRQVRIFPDDLVGPVSKTFVSPLRLAHVACVAYVASWLVPIGATWLDRGIARWITGLGRHSLGIFMLASLFSVLGTISLALLGRGLAQHCLINGVGLGILVWLGRRHDLSAAATVPPEPRLEASTAAA